MLYKEWLDEWLGYCVKPTTKARTYERYRLIVEQHIKGALGELELESISPQEMQQFIATLLQNGNKKTGQGLSANSVNGVISVLKNSLKDAYLLTLTENYVADKLIRPKSQEKQVSSFTVEEQKKIEEYVLSSKKPKLLGIVICLYTGLRIGELLALEFDDVEFETGLLSVTKTCYDTKQQKHVVEQPKTKSSNRVIPLPWQVINIIKELQKTSTKYIVSESNKPILVRSYQRSFELLLKKLGIPHKGFHSLRHTFATRALECGMDVRTLSEILGHKNVSITLNRYAHSMLEHKQEMMNKMAKTLFKNGHKLI